MQQIAELCIFLLTTTGWAIATWRLLRGPKPENTPAQGKGAKGKVAEPQSPPDLQARVEALERGYRAIEVEWTDWFDRYRRLYAKIAKRAKEAESATIEDHPDTEGGAGGDRRGNGQLALMPWTPPPIQSTEHLASRFRR